MKKDYTAWIVGVAVVVAFIVLICAWIFFFWVAARNKVDSVPLETAPVVQQQAAVDASGGASPR